METFVGGWVVVNHWLKWDPSLGLGTTSFDHLMKEGGVVERVIARIVITRRNWIPDPFWEWVSWQSQTMEYPILTLTDSLTPLPLIYDECQPPSVPLPDHSPSLKRNIFDGLIGTRWFNGCPMTIVQGCCEQASCTTRWLYDGYVIYYKGRVV
jgi:hypothetical protein